MIFYYRHRVLVVNNVCCLIFIIVVSSSPIISNFHRPSSVALSYFIGCLLNDVYIFESFHLSLHHLVANYVKNVDERGRNIMCVCTLPSLLVFLIIDEKTRNSSYFCMIKISVFSNHYLFSGFRPLPKHIHR